MIDGYHAQLGASETLQVLLFPGFVLIERQARRLRGTPLLPVHLEPRELLEEAGRFCLGEPLAELRAAASTPHGRELTEDRKLSVERRHEVAAAHRGLFRYLAGHGR